MRKSTGRGRLLVPTHLEGGPAKGGTGFTNAIDIGHLIFFTIDERGKFPIDDGE